LAAFEFAPDEFRRGVVALKLGGRSAGGFGEGEGIQPERKIAPRQIKKSRLFYMYRQ
jgi:hypothetical protein